jgi:hypothetical protein
LGAPIRSSVGSRSWRHTKSGAGFLTIVNETGSFMTAVAVGLQVFPDLKGLLGQ